MKLETFTATKGLERFPEAERFQIYHATHKRLLRENAEYRRSYQWRFSALVAAIILPLGLLQILGKNMGESVTATLLFVLLLIGHVFLILYASLRLQHHINQQVGGTLCPLPAELRKTTKRKYAPPRCLSPSLSSHRTR